MKKIKTPSDKAEKSKNYSILSRLWPLVKPQSGLLILGFIALFVTTVLMLAIPQLFRVGFDVALNEGSLTGLRGVFVQAGIAAILLAAFSFLRTVCLQLTGTRAVHKFRQQVFRHVLALDAKFFETRPAGEVVSRLTADVVTIRLFIQAHMPQLVRGSALFVGAGAMLLYTNWQLTLVLLAVTPVGGVLSVVMGRLLRKYSREMQDYQAESGAVIEENIYAIRTVQAFATEQFERAKFGSSIDAALKSAQHWIFTYGFFLAANIVIGFGAVLLVLWFGGVQVLNGELSLGAVMAYALYLAFMADAVGNLVLFYPALQTATGATERVFHLLDVQSSITDPAKPEKLPANKGGREVVFKDVSFAYPSQPETTVIKKLNLTLKRNQVIALVGRSGAGKSTLLSLLLRFYDPQQGKVLLDGVDIKQLKLNDLRQQMALVAQDPAIFSTTVRENIAYGLSGVSDKAIHAAAKIAYASEFIELLPKGLDTLVGEKGVRLSGGQKQRLAIARAVLRDPAVLLLDEATSHLDAESEQAVQQAFAAAQKNRTTLVIAHRLATVKAADQIVVLDKGEIVATGTHDKLIKESPLYRHLAELQFVA